MITGRPRSARLKGPPFRPSLVALLVGIAVAIPGVVVMVMAVQSTLTAPTSTVPGTTQMDLDADEYVVFEHVGGTDRYGPVSLTRTRGVTLAAGDVSVVGPDGLPVPVEYTTPNESIDRFDEHYVAAVRFDPPESGRYTLRFRTATRGDVMVVHPLGTQFRRHAPWLVATGIGWLTALVGMTMLLTGVIRRGRASRREERAAAAIAAAAPAPAAWYADPMGAPRWRYWDGSRWTDDYSDS